MFCPTKSTNIISFESKRSKAKAAAPDAVFSEGIAGETEIAQSNGELVCRLASVVGIPLIHTPFFRSSLHSSDGNKLFSLVQLVSQAHGVTDETRENCLAFINENCFIRVLGDCPSLSNGTVLALYRDKKLHIGYQEKFDRGTVQANEIRKMIEQANDDPSSSDPVGTFFGQLTKSVRKAVGDFDNCFFNLNPGHVETLVQDQSKGEFNEPSACCQKLRDCLHIHS